MMRKRKPRVRSSAARISRTYVALLTIVMLSTALATVSAVGLHLVRNKREDATQLMTVLKKSFSDYKPDWDYWRDTAPINVHSTFVRVSVTKANGQKHFFYSHNAHHFLQYNWESLPILKNIQYQPARGIYYHTTDKVAYTGHLTVRYEVWLSLNNVIQLFKLILEVITLITIIGIAIGIWLTILLAKRLNQPLVDLTTASQNIKQVANPEQAESLPVPAEPQEVHNLAAQFNKLLAAQNRQLVRDHRFVSDASHELRTPLAAIRGHIELLQRHGKQHPEIIPASLATIDTESRKMQALIESLLQLSRMDQAQLTLQPFDLSALCKQVAATYQKQLPQQLIVKAPEQVTAMGDPETVEHILLALLANARKYAPENSTILLIVAAAGNTAKMEVRDHGAGISAADKPRIFDRFYRVDASRSKKIPGTGLGLAIVARLAALNHGQVAVHDNQPHGSVFTLELQRVRKNQLA
ncbi:sensor histidine kinase [Lacticaseibacillus zhaodongensis]|uniref:sensor histidine kinase n=1 Tax=Lacticaseibacillus zhaodongensis TaxID=2668065 RepID=UPI001E2A6D63|nr:HAMP domain-containing sensor histidine kinase [Lacticaseibacillus zhaodongensis]